MSGFANSVVGGESNLIRKAIKSPDYSPGAAGWTINKDGTAEFNNLTVRGSFFGNGWEVNQYGIFLYSGTPANGNLIGYWTNTAGMDEYGNPFNAGLSVGAPDLPNIQMIQDGNGTFLQFPVDPQNANQVQTAEILSYVLNLSAANEQCVLSLVGPANEFTGAENQFTIQMMSDSDDNTVKASLNIYDLFTTPYLTIQNPDPDGLLPQMAIGQDQNGNQEFIPVTLNGALLSYGQNAGGIVTKTFAAGTNTWTPGTGITTARIQLWAAGAGGQWASGPGGGSGEYAENPTLAVTAGTPYTVAIGAGGNAGTSSSGTGKAGADTTFSNGATILVHSHGAPLNNANPSAGGTGSTDPIHQNGAGCNTTSGAGHGGGGGAGSPNGTTPGIAGKACSGAQPGTGGNGPYATGGTGGWGGTSSSTPGGDGGAGGAGGGSGGATNSGGSNGGKGGAGYARITYTLPGSATVLASFSSQAYTDSNGNQIPAGYQGPVTAVDPTTSPSKPETWKNFNPLATGYSVTGTTPNGSALYANYKLEAANKVSLSAAISVSSGPGTSWAGPINTTALPSQYRPAINRYFPVGWDRLSIVTGSNDAGGIGLLTPGGSIYVYGGATAATFLVFDAQVRLD